jgi:basic membrane protein A
MRLRATGLTLVVTSALLITACAGPGATTAPTGTAPAATTAPATTAATEAPMTEAPTTAATEVPTTTASPAAGIKIGVVTDVGRLDDRSFNQFSNQGAVDAATQLGGEHRVIVTAEVADYAANIQTLVDEDFDVIVTIGFLIGSDTAAAAKANPDVSFIGVDQSICVDEEGVSDPTFACAGDAAALLPNYQGVLFAEAQPGYMVGIIAASITESGTIGAVGGTNVPAVVAYRDGYINGAMSVDPAIEVLYQEADPNPEIGFDNPARGREIATQMIDAGADVIFQIAGNTGRGALEVVCDRQLFGIGVDVDQAESIPELAPCIVTSAEKKLQATVASVIVSTTDGTFEAGNVQYNAASDPPAIGISPYHEFESLITPDIQALVDAAFQGFVDGTVDPLASPAP